MLTFDEIAKAMNDAAGHPSSGPVAEWIPVLAQAVTDAQGGTPSPAPDAADQADEDE